MSSKAERTAAQTVNRQPDRPSRLFRVVKPSAPTMKTERCWLTKRVINCTDGCDRHYEQDNRNCKWKQRVYGCAIKQEHINQYTLKCENGTFVGRTWRLVKMIAVESAMNLLCTMMHKGTKSSQVCVPIQMYMLFTTWGWSEQIISPGQGLPSPGNRLYCHRAVM